MPQGCHISTKSNNMAMATMCAYIKSDHALPHWTFVLQCCAKFPCINLPGKGKDDQHSETIP